MRNVFKRTRCTSLGQSTPGDPNEVGPPQRRPPCAKVPNLPLVTVQSADQLRQLRVRIGPETGDNAVKGAYQGQDGRQVSPKKSGPTPGTHERHGRERAQPRERDDRKLERGTPRNLEHSDPLAATHRIREDGPGLDRSEVVERGEHGSESFELLR